MFVAGYQRALSLSYVDDLLARLRDTFVAQAYKPGHYEYDSFRGTFDQLLREAEGRAEARARGNAPLPAQLPVKAAGVRANGGSRQEGALITGVVAPSVVGLLRSCLHQEGHAFEASMGTCACCTLWLLWS